MKPRRVLMLVHEALVPPETVEGQSQAEIERWKCEFDVRGALRDRGHDVLLLGVADELTPIRRAIEEHRPHVAFNLLRSFQGVTHYDGYVVSYLELLQTSYTGANPRGLLLASDKVLSKKIFAFHRIPYPRFETFRRGRVIRPPKGLSYPLFVKSAGEHASTGIAQASIVTSDKALADRVTFIHESVGSDAIAEEYIEGRELYVGIVGNERLQVFPTWELHFENLPEGMAAIATSRVKWDLKYQDKIGVRTQKARGLSAEKQDEINRLARRIYRALGLTGYARIDFRMDAKGRLFVLEANANPDLSMDEDFGRSAQAGGLDFHDLVMKILSLGIRYQPAWKG